MVEKLEGRRIVFLDVDGVLCSYRGNKKAYTEEQECELIFAKDRHIPPIEKFNVQQLKDLIAKVISLTNQPCDIVLSTQWRWYDSYRNFLMETVLKGLNVVGDTEFEIDGRGEEVLGWLKSGVA